MTKRSRETVLDDLPDLIVIEEILVRLPPIDVLRCRAVRKSWHSGTSTDKFMLDNHQRQRLLPVTLIRHPVDPVAPWEQESIFSLFRDAGARASEQKQWPILRSCRYEASCDGFVIVSHGSDFCICNPVTRKCATLPQPRIRSPGGDNNIHIAGFYRHHPSGEYRVLWFSTGQTADCYVLTLGFDKPRYVGRPSVSSTDLEHMFMFRRGTFNPHCNPPVVHHRGSLHWLIGAHIMVFNTVTEKLGWMRTPKMILGVERALLQMDGKLASCHSSDVSLEVWVMEDYEAEAWALKFRIDLLAMEGLPVNLSVRYYLRMALLNERELLIWDSPRGVFHCDIDGKFLGHVKSKEGRRGYFLTQHYLQESLIPLPMMQEQGGVDNEPPFFMGL